jgi:two-component system cell cycle sensor histidine kinase PleC
LAAAKALEENEFSVAIIDLRMPELDGFGLLQFIRNRPASADLPVIVATISEDEASIERAYRLGASSFTTKPINWAQFGRHVRFVVRNGAAERKLRQAMAEAEQASRLKNGLFILLSHELKTPLTSLIGFTDVLVTSLQGRLSEEEARQFAHIDDAARRLNSIVGDILLYSRSLSGAAQLDIGHCAVADIIDDALSGVKRAVRDKAIDLCVRTPPSDAMVSCDAKLVQRAFHKLIDNAVKFAPKGGRVEIWVEPGENGSCVFLVRDDGPGMSESRLQECLSPFVQNDMSYTRQAEGLGLGLPVARSIADAHGGSLAFKTSPGDGMTASIHIPGGLRTAR